MFALNNNDFILQAHFAVVMQIKTKIVKWLYPELWSHFVRELKTKEMFQGTLFDLSLIKVPIERILVSVIDNKPNKIISGVGLYSLVAW